jgi:TonB family protein
MWLDVYGLREQPFGTTPDPRFLFPSECHREALASLQLGLHAGRGFMALIAEPGMGKTTLLFKILEETALQTAFIFQTQCNSREFMHLLMAEVGLDDRETDLARMHQQFNHFLADEARAGRSVAVIIDEAHNLEDSVLETVRLLSDFETPRQKLLQIVLAGQPELAERLARPNLVQLRQRISIFPYLAPLSTEDAKRYIDFRLKTAGYQGPPLFSPDAVAEIVAYSKGIPRQINNLCFHAMSLACVLPRRPIDADIIDEVLADFAAFGSSATAAGSGALRATVTVPRPSTSRSPSLASRDSGGPGQTVAHAAADVRTTLNDAICASTAAGAPAAKPVRLQPESAADRGGVELGDISLSAAMPVRAEARQPFPAPNSTLPSLGDLHRLQRRQVQGWSRLVLIGLASLFVIITGATWVYSGRESRRLGASAVQAAPPQTTAKLLPGVDGARVSGQRLQPRTGRSRGAVNLERRKSSHLTSNTASSLMGAPPDVAKPAERDGTVAPITGNAAAEAHSAMVTETRSFDPASVQPSAPLIPSQVAPNPIRRVPVSYPDAARRAHIEGDVVLSAVIDEKGRVEKISVTSGEPILAQAAVASVAKWRFEPARVEGAPQRTNQTITVQFRFTP